MAGESSQDRAHGRQPIELAVSYQRLNAFFSDYTRNISRGGTFIKTDKPLATGTAFVFKLHVPSLTEPLCINGRVQWVRTQADIDADGAAGGEVAGMGIRFEYRDDEERAAIERQIEKIMVDSLGQRLYSRLMEHSHSELEPEDEAPLSGHYEEALGPSAEEPALGADPDRQR